MFSVAIFSFCCLLVTTNLGWFGGLLLHLLYGLSVEMILLNFIEYLSSMDSEVLYRGGQC